MTDNSPANDNAATGRKCSVCNQPVQLRYKPFCSKRCADVDLNRWLTGKYAIPVEEGRDRPDGDERE
jgi:uncharacterized protein